MRNSVTLYKAAFQPVVTGILICILMYTYMHVCMYLCSICSPPLNAKLWCILFMLSTRQLAYFVCLLVCLCWAAVAVATDIALSANCRSVELLHVLCSKLLCEALHLAGPGLGGETACEKITIYCLSTNGQVLCWLLLI